MDQGRFFTTGAGRVSRRAKWTSGGVAMGIAGRFKSRWTAAVVVAALAACCFPAVASASVSLAGAPVLGPQALPHGLGLVPTPSAPVTPSVVHGLAVATVALPASVDLTPYAMPVGNQGDVGSCAAWATDYTALGYWENKEGIAGGGLEPMYTYSQVTGGVDDGSTIEGNLAVDEQQGVDDQSDYWQGNFDYWDQPTAAETTHAANWRLTSYADLPTNTTSDSTVTQQSIEAALAAGMPVVIGIPVYDNFFDVTAADGGYYDSISGDLAGYHAITALGYNASGLVIENSWGSGWGNGGFATLGWDFVNGYVFDAVSVGPLANGEPVASVAPALSGTAKVGQTLSASTGTWSPAATSYAYQWQRAAVGSSDWAPISGATAATYAPAAADVGEDLRVQVSATGAQGTGNAASAAVGPVTSNAPFATTAPAISGTLRQAQTLSANSGTWNPAGTSYTYQWQRSTNAGSSWSSIAGATAVTYQTTAADVNAYERVLVTATNGFGSTTASSPQVGPIATAAPVNATAPAISGALRVGQSLSVTSGGWSPTPSSITYQWQRSTNAGASWSNISGATATSYTTGSTDGGAYERVLVTATNSYGSTVADAAQVGPIAGQPYDTAAPTLSGSLREGQSLSATAGSWSPAATFYTYQWQRSTNGGSSWSNIAGATGATYATVAADVNADERVAVTATNASGSTVADSAQLGPISGLPYNTVAPALTGTPRETQYLYANTGSWSPAATTYAYQWQRSYDGGKTWVSVSGETNSYYALEPSDVGNLDRIQIAATNAYGTTYAWTVVGPIQSDAPVETAAPVISGTLREGQTLSTTLGSWSPAGDYYTYQWQRSTNAGVSWSNIAGATSSSYVTGAADVNARERVTVTAVNSFGTVAVSAAAVGPISGLPFDTTTPLLSGTPRQGQTLSVSTGSWSPAASTYTYQWQRSTNAGASWSNVAGANASTYVLAAADINAYERVLVTATNAFGPTTVATAQLGPVASGAPSLTTAPAISGTARQGLTLSVTTGSWTLSPTSYTYQWQRSTNSGSTWSNIAGATTASYPLLAADVNAYERVQVTATNAFGATTATTAQVGPVASGAPAATTVPAISGTARLGQVLSATTGAWTLSPTSFTYQWQRSTNGGSTWANIAGASAAAYVTASADVGNYLRVQVTATNAFGSGIASSSSSAKIATAAA